MNDGNEKHDDGHWRALAESLRSEEEPAKKAEIIRAEFGRKPPEESLKEEQPAADSAPAKSSKGGSPRLEEMPRTELISYLKSALDTLEKNHQKKAAGGQPADPVSPAEKPTTVTKIAPNIIAAAPQDEPGPQADSDRQDDAASTPLFPPRPAAETADDQAKPVPLRLDPSPESAPRDSAPAEAPPERTSRFTQEVPDFLRSRDITWPRPGATPARRARPTSPPAEPPSQPTDKTESRLSTIYPSQFPDPREAPPPWVKQENEKKKRKKSRLVPIAAAAAVILVTGSLAGTWFYARSGQPSGSSVASTLGTLVNEASNATVSGLRGTGRALKSLLPIGQDNPPVQSIVLLPQSQQPSVQIPTPGAEAEAPDGSLQLAAQPEPPAPANGEAIALTIAPASPPPPADTGAADPLKNIEPPATANDPLVEVAKLPEPPAQPAPADNDALSNTPETDRNLVLLPPTAAPAAEEPPAPAIEAQPAPTPSPVEAAPPVVEAQPPTPPAPEPVEEAPAVAVETPPAAQVAAVPPPSQALPAPPRDVWRVQLASVGDGVIAQSEWQRLQNIHPALLADQPLHVEQAELDRGTFFRIQAGAFEDEAGAAQLCTNLKARGQDCLVVR